MSIDTSENKKFKIVVLDIRWFKLSSSSIYLSTSFQKNKILEVALLNCAMTFWNCVARIVNSKDFINPLTKFYFTFTYQTLHPLSFWEDIIRLSCTKICTYKNSSKYVLGEGCGTEVFIRKDNLKCWNLFYVQIN